jgi:protocatechuate 3,4-dioxygenase beta subunit
LRRAQVTLSGDQNLQRLATTDSEGRYVFTDLPAGRFTLTAAKGGYLTLQYGQARPFEPGRPVTLNAAQALSQIDLTLPPASAISGRVTDRYGDPAVGARVLVERYQYTPEGQRRLTRASGTAATATDDRGAFRVFGLMPGEYVVSATLRQLPSLAAATGGPAPVDTASYVQTYHPGTPNLANAQPVILRLGEEATVHFGLASGRMSVISGTVTDSTGLPAAGAEMMLVTMADNGTGSGRGSGSVAANGSFRIPSVAPGQHYLQVRLPPRPGGPATVETANAPIAVAGSHVEGIQISTAPATTIAGTVVWEGTAPRSTAASVTPLRITAAPADGRPALLGLVSVGDAAATGLVAANGAFRLGGLAGSIRLSADGVPPDWTVKSIAAAALDLTNAPVDTAQLAASGDVRVVLTDRLTELTGSVRDAQGGAVAEYIVVVLPADPVAAAVASRYTRTLRPDQRGAFRVRGLPAGRYIAAAVNALEQGSEWDPAFQATVRGGAAPFTLSEGQTLSVMLELNP